MRWSGCWRWWGGWKSRGSRSVISTWAAGWAFAIATRNRRCRPIMPPRCWNALRDRPYEILIEPGRAIVGNAGILVTRVELLKQGDEKSFAVVDAAMNDLIAASAVLGLASNYPGRTAQRWANRVATMWWGQSAKPAIFSARTGN
jgi:hypothetical protein